MYTDSHCHLHYLKERPLAEYLSAMRANQVVRAMLIMCAIKEYDAIMSIIAADCGLDLGMSVGLHPCQDSTDLACVSVEQLLALNHDKVWALGETGLDYYWNDDKKDAQKHSFATHIHASQALKKPIIVHTRNAYADTLDILKAQQCEHGIIHCFTEDYAFAKRALDMGLYISFSGIVSFKKSIDLQETARKLPLDRILIETDSPYLAPVPKRGKSNEPAFVAYVAQALGDIFGKSGEEIGRITHANFDNLLNQYR